MAGVLLRRRTEDEQFLRDGFPIPCVVMDQGTERAVGHFVMDAVADARRTQGRHEKLEAYHQSRQPHSFSLSVFWDFGSLYLTLSLCEDVAAFLVPAVAAAANSASTTLRRHIRQQALHSHLAVFPVEQGCSTFKHFSSGFP